MDRALMRALAALLTACGLGAVAGLPAAARPVPEVITGEHLRLISVTSPAMASMPVGGTAAWDVGLTVLTEGEAVVDVPLQVISAAEGEFSVTVTRCGDAWTDAGCPTGATTLAAPALVTGAEV